MCLVRAAGAHCRMREVPGPHASGKDFSKGCCSPVQTHACFLATGVRVDRSRGGLAPAWNEMQLSMMLPKLAEVWSWDNIMTFCSCVAACRFAIECLTLTEWCMRELFYLQLLSITLLCNKHVWSGMLLKTEVSFAGRNWYKRQL